jgi:hypothetical protein
VSSVEIKTADSFLLIQHIKNDLPKVCQLAIHFEMDISLDSLEEALSIRRQMETLEKRLGALLGRTISSDSTTGKAHRRVSAATRAKLAAAARARWARVKGRSISIAHKSQPKKAGGLTPAGRRRLSQLMKARWAARRKAAAKK